MLTRTFEDVRIFEKRRQSLGEKEPNAVFVLFSGRQGFLSNFRAQSNFVYLTGFEESESCAVICTGKTQRFSLFVKPKDPAFETWEGELYGPQQAQRVFKPDECFPMESLSEHLKDLFSGRDKIYYALGEDPTWDQMVLEARDLAWRKDRTGSPKASICDPDSVIAPMRMIKDPQERNWMRKFCELSAKTHTHVMKKVVPGLNERQVQAEILYSFYHQKATREAYPSIVASGPNATTLHYRANCRDMKKAELVLIDAGLEKDYYCTDITRTYPVSGRFTSAQRDLYQAVLDTQKQLIHRVQPGFSLMELQEKACVLLTEKMMDFGLLSGKLSQQISQQEYKKYYPHGVGHYLGMDVHDVGWRQKDAKPVPFKEGMVITVEPGIYIPLDDPKAPKEFLGLGVRIEDDVLVGSSFPEVMSSLAPKEIEELESLVGSQP